MGFAWEGFDEMKYARITAQHLGARAREYYVTPQDIVEAIPVIARAYDEPFGNDSAAPTYFCAKMAREDGVRVLLAGDGGDEIFGGNTRYAKQKVFEAYGRIPQPLRRGLIEPLAFALPGHDRIAPLRKLGSYIRQASVPLPDRLETYNFLNRSPLAEVFEPEFLAAIDVDEPLAMLREVYGRTASSAPLNRMMHLDLKVTLADNDLRKVSRMCDVLRHHDLGRGHARMLARRAQAVNHPMLFNSVEFIFGFLPLTALVFFGLARWSHPAAAAWLTLASLFFYGWWNWTYVPLLMASALFKYACVARLARFVRLGRTRAAGTLFAFAVAANLLLLGYYKYANFLLGTWGSVTGHATDIGQIILPLGISFFTFTQIAFLADVRRGYAREYNPIHYGLFVTYFPHLIAGPILHHKEMMPQFQEPRTYRLNADNVAVGLTIFFIGLFKKTVIADSVAAYASPLFVHPGAPDLFAAWGGALAYTFHLYFDFSGYSDMAIGSSRVVV